MENEERFDFEKLRVYQKALEYVDRQVPRKPRPLGRGQGAQYKRKLPSREASPFRAGSFIRGSNAAKGRRGSNGRPEWDQGRTDS